VTKISCVRTLGFDAGHRVYGHEGKCSDLHGHRYKVELHARAHEGLDALGRVVDFSVLKEEVGGWIDRHWDHGLILYSLDPLGDHLSEFVEEEPAPEGMGRLLKLSRLPGNPTAENLAGFLLHVVCPEVLADEGCAVFKVVVWETPNCFAVAEVE